MANTTKNQGNFFHNDNMKKERTEKIEKQVTQVKWKILEAVIFTKMKDIKQGFLKMIIGQRKISHRIRS